MLWARKFGDSDLAFRNDSRLTSFSAPPRTLREQGSKWSVLHVH